MLGYDISETCLFSAKPLLSRQLARAGGGRGLVPAALLVGALLWQMMNVSEMLVARWLGCRARVTIVWEKKKVSIEI